MGDLCMKKKILSIFLTACLLVGYVPLSAGAVKTELSESDCLKIAENYWSQCENVHRVKSQGKSVFSGKTYYEFILQEYDFHVWLWIDQLYVEAQTGNCYYSTPEPEHQVMKISGNEQLTFEGILSKRTYEVNSGNDGNAYILKLDKKAIVSLFDSYQGYNGTKKELTEIQLNFSSLPANMDGKIGLRIKASGKAMVALTAHHLTPVVLTETEIVSEEQEENTQDFKIFENVTDMQQEFYFRGTHIATITLPESWKGHLTIEKYDDGISFHSILNAKKSVGGLLFRLLVQSDREWENWPHTSICREFKIDGQPYYLIYNGPTDVRYDYNDPACREEYQMMYADVGQIVENIVYHVDAEGDSSDKPFLDVPTNAYYYKAACWAKEKEVMVGDGKGHLTPEKGCTRAEVVQVLKNLSGESVGSSDSFFTDVPNNAWYSAAVEWAVASGITSGTGGGKFSPNAKCTRAQIVTFLWNYAGKPTVSSGSSFSDVKRGEYYENAVKWAVANGITSGTGNGKFSPNATCTRGQIVTFLYKYAG